MVKEEVAVFSHHSGGYFRSSGLPECIAAECGYALCVGASTHSDLMKSVSEPKMMDFHFAQTNSILTISFHPPREGEKVGYPTT